MEYDFRTIEKKWQQKWKEVDAYKVANPSTATTDSARPKCYVLDMFPYPSGAGLHVGHPLGYIASDIYSRYKRLKRFNVLHPMGYDSFGLPAEQYALETGQHPAVTTEKNISTFRSQLDKIGFSYDWSREIRTSDPDFYKWTQWIFLQIFDSWYNRKKQKAEYVTELVKIFEVEGNQNHPSPGNKVIAFSANEWNNSDEKRKQEILMNYRLAFSAYGEVNWCEALGTVLANDEVINGISERGGHPVEKRKMKQWYLRITEYADRLLEGLNRVEFSDAMKEMQKNWIGKSEGAEMDFGIKDQPEKLKVYTTRPDTIFGVDFMVLAPEHELVTTITTPSQKEAVAKYLDYVKSRSDRERLSEVKQITGCFTGAYAINPFDGREIPIWIAEYVLAGYGTGAIMAVPCGDQRDFAFAQYFNIPVTNIIGEHFNGKEANPTKEAVLQNSGFLTGVLMKDAIDIAIKKIEALQIGRSQTNYRMRDAGFSRQRYWGEPFPIIWSDGIAIPLDAEELPLELPFIEKYGPGPAGEGPLANLKEWVDLTPNPSPKERVRENRSFDESFNQISASYRKEEGTEGQSPGLFQESKTKDQVAYGYFNSTVEEWKKTLQFAKQNRKEATAAENTIWQEIRNRQIADCKFRRQHPIAGFIPDFVCLKKKLIIEIDGEYHSESEQIAFDKARENWLAEQGFTMLRFTNQMVNTALNTVLKDIEQALLNKETITDFESANSPLLWRGAGGEVKRETSTMPGYAGSSWYFLRYMDPHNDKNFCDRTISDYWNQVDLYIGGTEHAVGHLLYSRMWTKILYDLDYIGFDEPFKKLLNQGMITGKSYFFQLGHIFSDKIVSYKKTNPEAFIRFKYGHNFVDVNGKLTKRKFQEYILQYSLDEKEYDIEWDDDGNDEFIFLKEESEKMSKSKFNVDNPDDLVEKYGADTFRMYEMFLGPVEQSKPWDTKGIEGVHRFLRKLWRLFYDDTKRQACLPVGRVWNNEKPTDAELKILHRTIKKIEEDTERFSFNTAVSTFMIAVNELSEIKCHKKEILQPLLILLAPYAPHIAEELYQRLNNHEQSETVLRENLILDAAYPVFNNQYLVETTKDYPVSINGKVRTNINISLNASSEEVEKIVLEDKTVQKWLEGKAPKKIIYVKGKMINMVV